MLIKPPRDEYEATNATIMFILACALDDALTIKAANSIPSPGVDGGYVAPGTPIP